MLSAGKPIDSTKIRVLDDRQIVLLERQIGEIALQSNCMITAYHNRADLTANAFINGWYLTGDLGYMADGELYVTGRKKDLIIVGGKNIYPQDLENLAGELPGVYPGRVAAFGIPNEETGTEDVVIVAEFDGNNAERGFPDYEECKIRLADEIRKHVTHGSDIALRYVKIVNRGWLLKTSSGKVARSANREKYIAENSLGTLSEA
jgi:acyl-CoA synthetase (AMP-forming)/AMP-acid ligase II